MVGGQKPVERFQEANLSVSIWDNTSSKGAFKTASVQKSYKAKDSDEWMRQSISGLNKKSLETLKGLIEKAVEKM